MNVENRRKPIAVDLFSGCGGVTCGLKQAGFNVVGAVETDTLAMDTYAVNHPEVRRWHEDVRRVSAPDVLSELGLSKGELDLLAGCPPCQGFSSMRTLNGSRAVDDDRNDLIFEYARLALGLLPKALMFENVPGLLNDPRYNKLLRKLRAVGYRCTTAILDAADFGVPQRRRRMVMLAARGCVVRFAKKSQRRKTVAGAIRALGVPERSRDTLHNYGEHRSPAIRRLIADIPSDGGSRRSIPKERQLDCHRDCDGFYDVYGRMAWKSQAPTITTGCINPSKGRFIHPTQNRAITLREAALLQTFPPQYYFEMKFGKYRAAELIGNAFPPEFVRQHARMLYEHLQKQGTSATEAPCP